MTGRGLLVTGGAGFIGSNFVHHWAREHPRDRVVVLDALTYAGRRANLEPLLADGRVDFVHGDICDQAQVLSAIVERHLDTVVHLAAESHVDRSIDDGTPFVRTNVLGTWTVLDAARRAWRGAPWAAAARFHHVSTDEVYGPLGPGEEPVDETRRYAPSSPYAASKAAADHLVRAAHRTYGLPVTLSNCGNNYGSHQHPEKLIPLMLANALDGLPLPVYGDGSHIRDWLHVADHCRALDRVLTHGRVGETYHVGGGSERTNLDVVRQLCAGLDGAFAADASLHARFPRCPASSGRAAASLITHVADRPGHDHRYALDSRKLAAELGVTPTQTLAESLERTVRWYLDNEAWWRAVAIDPRSRAGTLHGGGATAP